MNRRPHGPEPCALTGLRYAPTAPNIITHFGHIYKSVMPPIVPVELKALKPPAGSKPAGGLGVLPQAQKERRRRAHPVAFGLQSALRPFFCRKRSLTPTQK